MGTQPWNRRCRLHGVLRCTVTAALYVLAQCFACIRAFEFYPPFLPEHVAVNETISQVELRVYLAPNETNLLIRITPASNSIEFSPTTVVFNHTAPVAQAITITAREEGRATISFFADVDVLTSDGGSQVLENATYLTDQEIDVLSAPMFYTVDDQRWQGVILLNDSFDEASFSVDSSTLWGKVDHGYPSASCGAADGDNALYFTALGDRYAMTKPISLLGFDGKIHFQHIYGFRSGQDYDDVGDNRVSCERVEPGEEVTFSYLPPGQDLNNASAWRVLGLLPTSSISGSFVSYSFPLPVVAMHPSARFRWHQKTHSSFPIDPASGLTLSALFSVSNDDSSVNGGLGVYERELWTHRNMFDQWALDDVRIEVRLNPPVFESITTGDGQFRLVSTNSGTVVIGIGYIDVLIDSPVANAWVEYSIGDGTHAYPSCDPLNVAKANTAGTARLTGSGYVHAIACLDVYNNSKAIVSSFPTRSKRLLVQARLPVITTSVDTTTNVDTWTIQLRCNGCDFMRYTAFSSPIIEALSGEDLPDDVVARVAPSCSFGVLINGSNGLIQVNSNSHIFGIACGPTLLPSDVTRTPALTVAPRAPTFDYVYSSTTITNEFNVTIIPPGDHAVGIVFIVGEGNTVDPICPEPGNVTLGNVTITVHASDVIRAVSCCVDVNCVDSVVSVWGPMKVQAVAPSYSMECSHMNPLTMVVQITPITMNAWIQYQVGKPSQPLNCIESEKSPFLYNGTIEIAINSTSVFVVSCLHGLEPSGQVEIPVAVEACCAGMNSFKYPMCAHVLLLHDDFSSCLDPAKWTRLASQWGGEDVNGGVHPDNINCVTDVNVAKNYLQLRANGDLFSGTAPIGLKRVLSDQSLTDRTVGDRYLEWALDGVSPTPCNELNRCPARRVGAAVQTTTIHENAGVMVIRLKPCEKFGTLTQIWWGDYTSRDNETLQEVPFLPLWKAGMYQGKTSPQISYVLSSPSVLAMNDTLSSESELDMFVEVAMQWNATLGRSNLYVNGQLALKQVLDNDSVYISSANEPLSIGVWFPNAVAGEPLFDTCDVLVDEVHVFKAEVTGGRWCDFEDVSQNSVPCSSNIDCEDWVYRNCFMPIHEAVCMEHRPEQIKQPTVVAEDTTQDDQDLSESRYNSLSTTQRYCQFRLQASSTTSAPSGFPHSSTEMTARYADLHWPVEEGKNEDFGEYDEEAEDQ